MIEVNGLTKTFHVKDAKVEALKGVSFTLEAKEILGVIGKSGAGKSTLLRCLSLLEKPDKGIISLNKINLVLADEVRMRQFRKKIGVVFQSNPLLKQSTVYENIAYPLVLEKVDKAVIDVKVKALLELIHLQDKANAYPAQLSGGQKQRVAIARALVSEPDLLLLDEPTSALDSVTTKSLIQLLKEIHRFKEVSILIITHELNVVHALCERVLVLDEGCFVEEGSVQDVFSSPHHQITKELLGLKDAYD